jgi:hypothetical protein
MALPHSAAVRKLPGWRPLSSQKQRFGPELDSPIPHRTLIKPINYRPRRTVGRLAAGLHSSWMCWNASTERNMRNPMKHTKLLIILAAVCLTGGMVGLVMDAQQPPPPPPGYGTMISISGTVTQFNYGPDAQVESFMLNRNNIVHFPPHAACAVTRVVKVGDTVKVDGLAHTNIYGTQSLELQSLQNSANGRQLTIQPPWSATAYSGSGTIRQLNYGPEGEINGFWLNNGVLAHIPPMPPASTPVLQIGASVALTGYARQTFNNTTAVDVSSLSVNGQAVPIYPPPPGPGAPPPPQG